MFRSRQADPELERLLIQFGSQVKALVANHCRAEQGVDADDVEQEVRIRLWKALERDRSASFTASYIQRVVISTVIDAVRRAVARPADSLSDEAVALAAERQSDTPRPDVHAADVVEVDGVMACIAALPIRRQRAVELDLLGFAQEEIGQMMGVSAESARKLISRGKVELKVLLQERGLGEFDD